jgi:hypothetical protein
VKPQADPVTAICAVTGRTYPIADKGPQPVRDLIQRSLTLTGYCRDFAAL